MNEKKAAVAFGEILLHLAAAEGGKIKDCGTFTANYGGTEANVLACLHALGHSVRYLTALPANELGEGVTAHLKKFGIDTSYIKYGGDTLAVYFSETGEASRGTRVVYQRKYSEFARLNKDSINAEKALQGADLFHISGISLALSPSSRELAFSLMEKARAKGITVSFDFNYRAALWSADEARVQLKKAAAMADILLASHRDLETFLQTDEEGAMKDYGCRLLVLRDRQILGADRHSVQVTAADKYGQRYVSPVVQFPVSERVGGGDAFDGAMLHAISCGAPLREATDFAIAAFALKHTIPGDTFTLGKGDILRYKSLIEEGRL